MATVIRMHRCVTCAPLRVLSRCVTSGVGEFRRNAKVPGVTIVSDDATAERALQVLQRLGDRVHGWDTETSEVNLGRRGQTPCHTGQVVCATAYCGDDVDFGDGPMLLIDNMGPAAGLIERKFRSYFEDASYKKVFHNYAFDKLMLKREGIAVEGLAADTLILARLHDTSLASWEGRERASKLMKDISMAEGFDRSKSSEGKEPSRAVKGVAFAGKKIDLKSFSSASNLHTISIPMEHATKIKELPKMRMGYDLKSLAFQYGITGSMEPASFRQLFGASGNAAREKFDSPDHFTEFATYAAYDAVYTWKLFHFFQESLQKTAWNSGVQRRPIDKLLMDDAVADELRDLRPQLFRMSRPKEQVKNRLPSSGGAAGTSASVQQDTGKTMWDFYSEYLSSRFSECLASMQERGISVDRARLQEIERHATEDLRRMESQYKEILGEIEVEGTVMNPDSGLINPQSHQQLRQLLFGGTKNIFDESEQLEATRDFSVPKGAKAKDGSKLRSSERFTIESWGLEPAAGRKMFTKKGWPSTGKEALEKLQKDEAQNVQQQLEAKGWDPVMAKKAFEAMEIYRQMASVKKILTAFARPMQEHASEMNRIHPSWSYGTSTGRLSCSNPNLQGIPADSKDTYGVRGAFIAGEGKTFIMADYSQLELRILAHMSQCPSMKKHFLKGGDYHSEVAADMYPYIKEAILRGEVSTKNDAGPDLPSVKSMFPQERKAAKAVNFGIVYGAQAQSLAEDLNISEDAAVELMEAWFKNKKAVRRWLDDVKAQSSMEGKSRSLLGKHRHLPLLKEDVPFWLQKRSERAAVNFVIQGSGADLVTAAMLQLESHPRLTDLGFHFVMQVHDEFVLEGPSDTAQEASEIVKSVMEKPFKETMPDFSMLVPLEVSISVSDTLAEKA